MNLIKEESFSFALAVVNCNKFLREQKKEFVMSKQLLRSGTAIGALYREAEHAESKADFIHKLALAQKESNESLYWIDLLHYSGYLNDEYFQDLRKQNQSIVKILAKIIITMKAKQ